MKSIIQLSNTATRVSETFNDNCSIFVEKIIKKLDGLLFNYTTTNKQFNLRTFIGICRLTADLAIDRAFLATFMYSAYFLWNFLVIYMPFQKIFSKSIFLLPDLFYSRRSDLGQIEAVTGEQVYV